MNPQTATQTHQQKPTTTPAAGGLLQRKCACGNHTIAGGECAECSKKQGLGLQTKLKVNEPGDTYEQEADRIADQVLAAPVHHAVSGTPPRIQRFAGPSNGQMDAAPASVDRVLASPGRPLEPALRQDMEQRFGHDFSPVRVHSGATAEQSARHVNAHAYTVGHDMVFGVGRFVPGTHAGRRLLAHELTHVVQQSAADGMRVGQSDERRGPFSASSNRLAWAERGVRGLGLPLPAGPRALLEAQFGSRFGDVRLHTGPRAADAARQLGAAAYTLGRDIVFGQGFYTPHTGSGLRLLSHELAHVVQSQGAPARPLAAGEAAGRIGPLEREAERASNAFGRGPTVVRQRLVGRMPLCHPVYISAHGDKAYLARAAEFHRKWGKNAPVHPGVPSIEAVLRDLAGQSSIGQVTIVSHANPALIRMQFVDGGPDEVLKSDWQVGTVAELVNLERHLVKPETIDKVIEFVQIAEPLVLPRIGPVSDPLVRQFIWWVVDQVYAEYAGFPAAQAVEMRKAGQAHAAVYRSRLLSPGTQPSGAGSGQPAVTATDLDAAERAVKTQAIRFTWPKPARAATEREERRLRESPSAAIQRVTQKPDFFHNLTLVRGKISNASWIEIQGCNAGQDRGYLEGIQSFFGGAGKKPKVTAPDWFQSFGHYGYTTIREEDAPAQWLDKGVKAALVYWYRIITGNPLPKKPTEQTLLEYLRQGHALPLAIPGAPGSARVLLLNTQGRKAFLEWLSRHSYQLTEKEIEQKLFAGTDLRANIEGAVVDMLKERTDGPTRIIFRPSRAEYEQHIIKVP